MNPATQEWILGIAGVIIMLLLGGNGYWIKRLVASIDKLRETVVQLQVTSETQKTEFLACKDRCEKSTETVTVRLNDHSKTLKRHGEAIATIKGSLKIEESNEGQ